MKKNLTVILIMLSMTASAQFPEPLNFEFSFNYIMMFESGFCDGQIVGGPTYCSHFNWTTPDTSSTSSNLEYYNIYYYQYSTNDTLLIASIPDTLFEVELGVLGEVWVTAVYSNPEGESVQSNIIVNEDLPIIVNENKLNKRNVILYNRETQRISINNSIQINKLKIFDSQGKLCKSLSLSNNTISTKNLPSGLYIIEAITDNNEVIRQKIVK